MTPEQFMAQIATAVAAEMKKGGPTLFKVVTTQPSGQQFDDQKSLPQCLVELRDTICINAHTQHMQFERRLQMDKQTNELATENIRCMRELIRVLEENRKVGVAILAKKSKGIQV